LVFKSKTRLDVALKRGVDVIVNPASCDFKAAISEVTASKGVYVTFETYMVVGCIIKRSAKSRSNLRLSEIFLMKYTHGI
jgi:hypothetical protein